MDIREFMAIEGEKPLDHLPQDGGMTAILRTVAVIGDSLASGEFEGTSESGAATFHDMYEHSWGQYIARMAGLTVYNFSRGGMTAAEYCDTFAEANGFWDEKYAARAYIMALGVNDVCNQNRPLGSMEDICFEDGARNAPTFTGYFARILQHYRAMVPDAPFFLLTMPRDPGEGEERTRRADAHAARMYEIAATFPRCYVIDLRRYAPLYDAAFKKQFFLGGHMNACGYLLTARMVAAYIDYIIRHNPDDFRQIGFVGTPYRNTKA